MSRAFPSLSVHILLSCACKQNLRAAHTISLLCVDAPMDVDDQQQAAADGADSAAASKLRTSDLQPQPGVGRCYYTSLPRLVKVRPVCALTARLTGFTLVCA